MVEVTKKESEAIRSQFPDTHIARTKHHWYSVENKEVRNLLRRMRGETTNKKNTNRRKYGV